MNQKLDKDQDLALYWYRVSQKKHKQTQLQKEEVVYSHDVDHDIAEADQTATNTFQRITRREERGGRERGNT